MLVVAFVASQVTDTYARGSSNDDENFRDGKNHKVRKVEITNWEENPCCEAQKNNIPQVIQREYSAITSSETILDIGTFTVPPSKRLVIELITARVPSERSNFAYPISVITTVDGITVEHSKEVFTMKEHTL